MQKELLTYFLPVVVMAVVVWRMARRAQGQPVKPSRLWIRPAMLALFLVFAFLRPPAITVQSVAVFAAAAGLGIGLGYLMARHQHLTLDSATGTITSKTSPLGIALFVALFAGRYAFRTFVQGGQAPDKVMAHSDQVMMWTDAGLVFGLAVFAAQAWETWRRAKPSLADHAQKKAESQAE